MRVGGIVLCGGESRRMGRAKAWLPFGEQPMLVHIAHLLEGAVTAVIVAAAPGQELPPLPSNVFVYHDQEPGLGPLQGLATGLTALGGTVEAAFVTGCDTPLLQKAFVTRMIELLGDKDVCIPYVAERFHPLPAVYRLSVLAEVSELLKGGKRRLLDLLEQTPNRVVVEAELRDVDPELLSLRNLNTPEEYEAACGLAGER